MTQDQSTVTGLPLLRRPFPPNQISKLPKPKSKDAPKGKCGECGGWHGLPAVHLDYVGHAALTDRLLDADPSWTWEPLSLDDKGLPALDANGGLWIKLTVCGVTRLGYGDAQGKTGGDAMKERIGDALRNAAMRFGAALDLWHKGDLHASDDEEAPAAAHKPTAEAPPRPKSKMSDSALADHTAAIGSASTLAELKRAGDLAHSVADTLGDELAKAKLGAAYAKRKKELTTKEPA